MKIVVIYGSGRKNSYSSLAAEYAASHFKGYDIREYHLHKLNLNGCRGCMACRKIEKCVIKDDMQAVYEDVVTSDFIIFASPVYCFDEVILALCLNASTQWRVGVLQKV